MSTATWLLTPYTGATITVSGQTLSLKYDSAGRMWTTGSVPAQIYSAECTTDYSDVYVDLTADNSTNNDLGEAASNPQKEPTTHTGTYTWRDVASKHVLLNFAVPSTTGIVWGWIFGNTPPIALKGKIKVKR